jgi:L-rhamnose-H+ transport protein
MVILSSLLLYLVAGLVNGSFATPSKYITNWKFENIWLQHALWAFLILPWITIFLFAPQVFEVYRNASPMIIGVTVLGGILFGIGQIASAFAIHMIGIGLAFVICIGISTGLGFFIPLVIQHPEKVFTPFGYVTIAGTLLAILGFIFSTYAGKLSNKNRNITKQAVNLSLRSYFIGVLLALLAGLFSAGQNISFSLTSAMQTMAMDKGATSYGAAMIMWPAFLTFAFIPYALYMLF